MATPAQQLTTKRMTLAALERGKKTKPIRVLLFGVEGIGKSTFGASAPTPVVIDAERGTDHLDVQRFSVQAWPDVVEAVETLTVEPHDLKTLVIDTLDKVEGFLWDYICKRDKKKSIEDYGYSKGYIAALDEWRVFLASLERLRDAKGMHIVLLAHSWVKPFKNPEGDDFDRYELKLNPKAGGLLKEWCDAVLFANHETLVHKDDKTKRVRGIGTGARLIHATRTAAYDAKNRYSLPERLALDWDEFAVAAGIQQVADPKTLAEEIAQLAMDLPPELAKKATDAIARADGDATKLAKLLNWTKAQATKTEKENES
jgi:hypothetical protein